LSVLYPTSTSEYSAALAPGASDNVGISLANSLSPECDVEELKRKLNATMKRVAPTVYCVGFLFVPVRGCENKYGQRSINSLTVEFEASQEQNA
jgi:hypothetical protein